MRSRLPNTQAGFLPSKKSQKVSEERIAKINELYENIKRGHRDSVVSNNSTSVASQEQGADNCIPISTLEYRLPRASHTGQLKVKRENDTISPFRANQTSTPSASKPLLHGFQASGHYFGTGNDSCDGDDDDEDYEAELRFTPKLKSRRSLITMRRVSNSEEDQTNDSFGDFAGSDRSNKSVRKLSRISSLRKTLGDPLPLPYVSKDPFSSSTSTPNESLSTASSVENKRKLMEKKWRNLIAKDKERIEKRFSNLRQQASPVSQEVYRDESIPLIPTAGSEAERGDAISELSRELIRNGEKLDNIISLLTQKDTPNVATTRPRGMSRETQFWTICIIILILCNYYVYHYF